MGNYFTQQNTQTQGDTNTMEIGNVDQRCTEEIAILQKSLNESDSNATTHIILLSTGSFNPPHYGHIETFHIAEKYLQKEGGNVIGCIVVPSSDNYVINKLKKNAIPFQHRAQLIQLMINESYLMEKFIISKAESHYNIFYEGVVFHYQDLVKLHFPNYNIKVVYLCGSDRGNYLHFHSYVWRKDGAIVINRPEIPLKATALKEPWLKFLPGNTDAMSSSQLRGQGYDGAGRFLPATAVEYLKEHNLLFPCKNNCRWKESCKCECKEETPLK